MDLKARVALKSDRLVFKARKQERNCFSITNQEAKSKKQSVIIKM